MSSGKTVVEVIRQIAESETNCVPFPNLSGSLATFRYSFDRLFQCQYLTFPV
jgi:hypothetical protein